jgi:hypothetical protein
VTREVGRWAMRRRSPLRPRAVLYPRGGHTLRGSARRVAQMREEDEFSGAFKPQRTSARGFRPKCFNYSRHKSVGNVKSAGWKMKSDATISAAVASVRVKHRIKLEEKQKRNTRCARQWRYRIVFILSDYFITRGIYLSFFFFLHLF